MKKQFYDKFDPIDFYKRHRRSLAMEIGLKLSSGMDLAATLKTVSIEASTKREEEALISASERLKKGENAIEVLKNKAIQLDARDRFVLSLPMADLQKGNILKGWLFNKKRRERHACSLKTIFASISFLGCVIVALFAFVIPMFHEISMGVNANSDALVNGLDNILSFLAKSELFIVIPLILLPFIGFLVYLGKMVFNSKTADEEADIIGMIASSDYENQWNNLEMVSNRICFPKTYRKLNKLSKAVSEGIALEECIAGSGLSPMLTWFLQLSIHNREDRSFLDEGAEMMKQQADYVNNRRVMFLEIMLVVAESLTLFVFLYYVFGMMEAIKVGIMS